MKLNFCNRIVLKLILSLILLSNINNTKTDSVAGVVIGASIGALGGIVFACLCKNDKKVIDKAKDHYNKALKFKNEAEIIDQKFNVSKLSKSQMIQKSKIVDEKVLEELSVYVDSKYCSELKSISKNLATYKVKVSKCLECAKKKAEKSKTKCCNLKEIQILLDNICNILSKLEFLQLYVSNQSKYFEIDSFIEHKSTYYEKEIELFSNDEIDMNDFKKIVRQKFNHNLYPCIEYVNSLNGDIKCLTKYINKYCKIYPKLISQAEVLVQDLEIIKENIISDKEYFDEQRELDKETRRSFRDGVIIGTLTSIARSNHK